MKRAHPTTASGGNGTHPLLPPLLDRRRRLQAEIARNGEGDLSALLTQVDAALDRLHAGHFGLCRRCHEPVEDDRLLADPLVQICLGCLSDGERSTLEHDLSLAGRIQQALLPPQNVSWGGWDIHFRYLPAGPVSGDYIDIVQPSEPEAPLHFFLGDVSGKGVSASILMSSLHAIFRSLVAADLPLSTLTERANRLFTETTLPAHFATLVCGRVGSDGTVQIVNAGHLPPLALGRRGPRTFPASGLPVGIFSTSRYRADEFQMEPDDLLFLHTDGLSEAAGDHRELYGVERLRAVLEARWPDSAVSVTAACLEDLARFCGDVPRGDDLTVLALHRAA